MAEKFFVRPADGEVVAIPEENEQKALDRKYVPATDAQVADFKARDEAAASPVSSFVKRGVESVLPIFNPADWAYGALSLPTQRETSGIVSEYLAQKPWGWAQDVSKAISAGQALQQAQQPVDVERTGREAIKDIIRPITTPELEVELGVTTPEAYRARAEVAPKVNLPLLGETPVPDLLGLVAASTLPRAIAKRTALSTAGKSVRLAEAEAASVDAVDRARQLLHEKAEAGALTQEGAALRSSKVALAPEVEKAAQLQRVLEKPPIDLREAMEEATKAGEQVAQASAAVEARKAFFSKFPKGERLAQRAEQIIKAAPDASTLEIISNVAGRPISQAVERSTLNLIEKSPLSRAPQVVKDIVARGLATGAGSSADMALMSLGMIPQEEMLGDTRITGEQAMAGMSRGALKGFLPGAVLGAAPPAIIGTANAVSKASEGVRNVFVDLYRTVSPMVTELNPETQQMLESMRSEFDAKALIKDPVDLIRARLDEQTPKPIAPRPAEQIGQMPVVTDMPMQPPEYVAGPKPKLEFDLERPVEPQYVPKPAAPLKPIIKEVDLDPIAIDLTKKLQERDDLVGDLRRQFTTDIRRVEEREMINHEFELRAERATSDFQEELGGRPLTKKDQTALNKRIKLIMDQPKAESLTLADAIDKIVKDTVENEPRAVEASVMNKLTDLAEKTRDLAKRKDLSPGDYAHELGVIKHQAYDLTKERVVTQAEQTAKSAANKVGRLFIDSLENEGKWGASAVREQLGNRALLEESLANENLMNLFGIKEKTGIKRTQKVYDANAVKKFLSNLSGAEMDTLFRRFQERERAIEGLVEQVKLSSEKYEGATNIPDVVDSISRTAKAFEEGQAKYLQKIVDEHAISEHERMAADYKQTVREITKQNNKIKAEYDAEISAYEQLKAEAEKKLADAKEQYPLQEAEKRADAAQKLADYKEELRVIESRMNEAKQEIQKKQQVVDKQAALEVERFNQRLAGRKQAIDRQMELLKKSWKFGMVKDAAIALGIHANPIVGALATSYRVLANPVSTYKALDLVEKAARSTRNATYDIVDWASGYSPKRPAGVRPAKPLSMEQQRELYQQRAKELRELSTPKGMSDHLKSVALDIETAAPKIAAHSRMASAAAIAYLNSTAPKPPPGLAPMQQANWMPPDHKIIEQNQRQDAVENPVGTLYRMAEGSATKAETETMDVVYKALMADVRERMLRRMKENPNMPAERRRMMSRMLNVDIDGSAAAGAAAQQVYGAQNTPIKPAVGSQIPISRAAALNVSARESMDTVDRRTDQEGARR
jgi:hypothetical protein